MQESWFFCGVCLEGGSWGNQEEEGMSVSAGILQALA